MIADIGSSIKLLLGSDVTLLCDAQGLPKPKTSWTSNGEVLGYGKRLQLKNLKNDNPVNYTCTALNLGGKVSRHSSITMLSKYLLI